MRNSGYRSIFHIYLIFFILLVGIIVAGLVTVINVFTIQAPGGNTVLSNWPKNFAEGFSQYIDFTDSKLKVVDEGLKELDSNGVWLQILDAGGNEVFSHRKPKEIQEHYTSTELLQLDRFNGIENSTVIIRSIRQDEKDWIYITVFPVRITELNMLMNGEKFSGGKPILLGIFGVALLLVVSSGAVYGFWITKQMSGIIGAVGKIADRSYDFIEGNGIFGDVYNSLNLLDKEIRENDEARLRNEKLREEWIANITHDLKTPLSPIKGYAELIADQEHKLSVEQVRSYGEIILRNSAYTEELINDLKLAYQLENEMVPLSKKADNIVRFVREIVIDFLNNPEYEGRNIEFRSDAQDIKTAFDAVLLKRALYNLLCNSLVHNTEATAVEISVKAEECLHIIIKDNGRGMGEEELRNLFIRYYRGTNTVEKPEGTGLGMAIAKQIIELHKGSISVESVPDKGTSFLIELPLTN